MRGEGWLAADLPGHLIVRTSPVCTASQTLHADVLTIDPFAGTANLRTSKADITNFKLAIVGPWALVDLTHALNEIAHFPKIIASRYVGILDAGEMEQSITEHFREEDLLVVGNCGWFDHHWCASPLGLRRSTGRWLQFMAAGGNGGIAFPNLLTHEGIDFKDMSPEVTESQVLQTLSDAISVRYPQLAGMTIIIGKQDLQAAAVLVLIRKAFGPYNLSIYFSESPLPAWKRLAQHLNATIISDLYKGPSASIGVESFVYLLESCNLNDLIAQINRSSRVIPESLK